MKCKVTISPDEEERVEIYAREKTPLIEEIKSIAERFGKDITAYGTDSIYKIKPEEAECFISEEGRVYVICEKGKLRIKERLYIIEEMLGGVFIKLNQSCLANINMIERFEYSFAGAIRAVFKSGYKDYISRRQLKHVKERMEFNL